MTNARLLRAERAFAFVRAEIELPMVGGVGQVGLVQRHESMIHQALAPDAEAG